MTKITLGNVGSIQQNPTTAQSEINTNFSTIQTAMDNTLSRDGTAPNQMGASLDMNSNTILNLPTPADNFSPVRLIDVSTLNGAGTINVSPLPAAGTTGQILAKNSNTDYDVIWSNPAAALITGTSGVSGGISGQVLFNNAGILGGTSAPTLTSLIGNPATGANNLAINTTQNFTGTMTPGAPGFQNLILINTDTADGSGSQNDGTLLRWHFGGTGTKGTRVGLHSFISMDSSMDAADTGSIFSAMEGTCSIAGSDNGGSGTEKGEGYGGLWSASAVSGASHINKLYGSVNEFFIAPSGASVANGASIVARKENGGIQASGIDCALLISSFTSSALYKTGILFHPIEGQHALGAGSTLFATSGSNTVANGFDISSYTFSGNEYNSANMQITGAGSVNMFKGGLTLGNSGVSLGSLSFANLTSGKQSVTPATGALGAGIATLPTGTYNLVGDTLTQTLSGKALVGVIDNSSATAGNVGELISSSVLIGSAVSLTTNTAKDVTTITLSAGDWDIQGNVHFLFGATTSFTQLIGSVSATLNTLDTTTPGASGRLGLAANVNGGDIITMTTVPVRVSITTNTTYHLVAQAGFTVSTMTAYGFIRARRIR